MSMLFLISIKCLQKRQVHLQIGGYELINLTNASEDEVKNKRAPAYFNLT